jgi:predicted RNA-binding Zn-ribbon protein involved in translation (DUF1610 family)
MESLETEFNEWQCPKCGWDTQNDCEGRYVTDVGDSIFAHWIAIEYGGNPYYWDTTYKCPVCETTFIVRDSNY